MIGIDGLEEKNINLSVTLLLKEKLEEKGYTVVLTREEDKGLYDESAQNKRHRIWAARIALIETAPALTVSIHQNSYHDPAVKPQVFCTMKPHRREKNFGRGSTGKTECDARGGTATGNQGKHQLLSVEEEQEHPGHKGVRIPHESGEEAELADKKKNKRISERVTAYWKRGIHSYFGRSGCKIFFAINCILVILDSKQCRR